jgi:pimeloyl-ACP methyl ester carboxylesterase
MATAKRLGFGALLFDYSGCGASEGTFEQGTISRWTDDALAVIEAAPAERFVLVGSSMGGWIALRVASALAERVAGMILLAPAPDFTRWGVCPTDAERSELAESGLFRRASAYGGDYTYTRALLEDGEACALLGGPIAVGCPVRILHGQADPDVPWQTSLQIADRLTSPDVQITLVKHGDHRLSRAADLARLDALIGELSCVTSSS